jgi:hypothetical protein
MPTVDPLSAASLLAIAKYGSQPIGQGTCFFIKVHGHPILVTNWHVVSGRHYFTRELASHGGIPNKLEVFMHVVDQLGTWRAHEFDLLSSNGNPRWTELRNADVVLLPVNIPSELTCYPVDLALGETDIQLFPSSDVSIVGYPNGQTGLGKFPIWKTGHMATDYEIDYFDAPSFLIDATTKQGMSGSPVYARRAGSYQTSQGDLIMSTGIATKFLGVYSGRIPEDGQLDSSVGIVWKAEVIESLLIT